MSKIYELCYIKRELLIHDTKRENNMFNKIQFKIVSYLANKY